MALAETILLLLIWFTDIFSRGGGTFHGMEVVKSPVIIVKILAWIIFLTPLALYFYSSYILKTPLGLWISPFNISEIQKSWIPAYDIIKPPGFFK